MAKDDAGQLAEKQEDALRRAGEAAGRGDALGLVEALSEARALDGLARRLRRQWPGLQATDLEDVVARALDDLQAAVMRGERIASVMGWCSGS